MKIQEKKIHASVTVSDQAQVIALCISLVGRLSSWEHVRFQVIRTIAAFYGYDIQKHEA